MTQIALNIKTNRVVKRGNIRVNALQQALASLDEAIRLYHEHKSSLQLRKALRDSVIQRFEYTYELAWKAMQGWLRDSVSPEIASTFSTRKDLYRTTAKHGLINNPADWFDDHEARNLLT